MIKSTLLALVAFSTLCSFTFTETPIDDDDKTTFEERVLYDFQNVQQRRTWFPLNDNVMGGISTGSFEFTSHHTLLFSGQLSLQNKGGFASIRSKTDAMDLKGSKKFKLRVKGDGKSYYFNISSSNFVADPGFQAAFKTEKGKWQEIEITLDQFSPAFGSRSSKKDLDMSKVKIMGIIISDKQAGDFNLEIDWIKAV